MVAVGISGATGCIYGIRLLEALQYTLTNLGRENFTPAALELLRADPPVGHTERYAEHVPEGEDFRHCISRKPRLSRPDPDFAPQPYYQVFSERMPFVPNLSIVDLLFCEGPSSAGVLAASVPSAGVPSVACSLTEGGARPDGSRFR